MGVLDGCPDDDLEQVSGPIQAEDQSAVGILSGVFDGECVVDGVIDVLVGDTVLSRRVVNLHSG